MRATSAGLKTALFLDPPKPAQLARHPGLQALGVAGLTRSLPPDEIEHTLRPAFTALRSLNPRHFHYKVCSTFAASDGRSRSAARFSAIKSSLSWWPRRPSAAIVCLVSCTRATASAARAPSTASTGTRPSVATR